MDASKVRESIRRAVHPAITCSLLLIASGACRSTGPARAPATQVDRLMQVYPELQSGRFLVIADFEDASQMDLFQLISVSDSAKCVLDAKKGRRETGGGCAEFTTGSPDDTIVITNSPQAQWYLKRDWRAYDLLLMSVHSPDRGASIEVTIGGGPPDRRTWGYTNVPLERGWNVVRLDLAEVGEQIPLDDVQEMRLALPRVEGKVRLRLDDILLAYNREDLLGDSNNATGGLYVQRVGRRWNIGAGGRFELTVANGQIVRWFNLAADPHRLRNLVAGTTLGPSPVIVGGSGPDQTDFSILGKSVVVRQWIEEMSAVRAVVRCEWRFADDPGAPLENRPFQRWAYTVYPTGQMFVQVEATAKRDPDWAPPLGLAVTFSSAESDEVRTRITSEDRPAAGEGDASASKAPLFATARSRAGDSFLLYVPGAAGPSGRILEQPDSVRRRTSLVAVESSAAPAVKRWVAQVFLSSTGQVSDEEVVARSIDYLESRPLKIEVGSPVVKEGGERADGFDSASGCYVIAPEESRVRFVIDGTQQASFSPAFRIARSDWQEAWVYVDHLILEPIARAANGDLLFQLPQTVTDRAIVEVLFRRGPAPNGG